MNKFGFVRGKRGPRGYPGEDALKLHLWFPESILKLFRESASCSYYFDNATDGILYDKSGKKIGLKNQSESEKNATCVRGETGSPVQTGKTYSLTLSKENCFLLKLSSAIKKSSVLIVAFSFKLKKPITDNFSYYIFSNENSTRAVTLRSDRLDIAGCARGSPQLKYLTHSWNYMLIQYSRVSDEGSSDRCFFILNGRRGFFDPVVYENDARELYIGHRKKLCANIELNYFEAHSRHFNEPSGYDYILPETISTLLLKHMESRVLLFEDGHL